MQVPEYIKELIAGTISSTIGYIFIFHRKVVIEALLASNSAFWNKLDYNPNKDRAVFMANIMIPIMGACFLVAGIFTLYKFITHMVK